MAYLEFKDIKRIFPGKFTLDMSLQMDKGELLCIIGPSGSGKSTLLSLLCGVDSPDEGRILIDGTDITDLAIQKRRIGMVFQDFRLFPDKTAYENVAFAMRAVGTPPREIRQRVPILLRMMQVEDKASHFPLELSGGERQRVALARALANNPDIIVADEPTGNVDPEMSLIIMNLLKRINTVLGKTVIVVTHEQGLVDTLGQRVIRIESGRVASDECAGGAGQ